MRDVLPRSLVSLRRVDRTCYAVHTSTQNYFVVSSLTLNSCAFVSLSSKMPPHGAGMCGATHSHSVEFPDDNWNLYSMLDTTTVTALNVTRPADAVGIFKPFVHRLSIEPELISDSDEEIIVIVRFTSPVHVRKIMIIGGGMDSQHPSSLRCFPNKEMFDFTNVNEFTPAQIFNLPVNVAGTVELTTVVQPFTNISSLVFYFPANHGHESTVIKYIGMQGEHTHHRREAVDATYEVLCNGQDIIQPESDGATDLSRTHARMN